MSVFSKPCIGRKGRISACCFPCHLPRNIVLSFGLLICVTCIQPNLASGLYRTIPRTYLSVMRGTALCLWQRLYRQNILNILQGVKRDFRGLPLCVYTLQQLSSCYREYMLPLQSLQNNQQLRRCLYFLVCLRNGCSSNKPSCIRGMELQCICRTLKVWNKVMRISACCPHRR